MIEIKEYREGFNASPVLKLWADTFGEDEALLEKPQVDGSESEYNIDYVYTAEEDGVLLGTIHITIPKKFPSLCGMSGMAVTPASRGKGIARILFSKAIDEMREKGVEAAFLGTNNPVAAKLYTSLGFRFIPCSIIMENCMGKNLYDYMKPHYLEKAEQFETVEGTPDFRIPIIPLVVATENITVLDINTEIVSSMFAQRSCMGLFPRYLTLKEKGGSYFGAIGANGVFGAMMSVAPTHRGNRADFFFADGFCDAIPALLKECEVRFKNMYLQIAKQDEKKLKLAKSVGFIETDEVLYDYQGKCFIPMVILEKN